MNTQTKIWIKSMSLFDKYWGCHQIPERSFFFKKYQLPICARCTGIIFGEIFGLLTFISFFKLNIIFSTIITFPLIIDGTAQYYSEYISNNTKRLITGLLFGFGFLHAFCTLLNNFFLLFLNL